MNAHQSAVMIDQTPHALRPPAVVMSPARAGAAYPNALSFPRNLVRRMQKDGWKIDCPRFALDAEGRGRAVYRIDAAGTLLHFLVVSNVFPASQKIDRAFGINWDVSAAVCDGEWSQEREDILTVEIPKQYDGRYDAGVLCFCRGNRSERIFDEVVTTLASGRQPDVAMLASVGYLLRSTAFGGNGLFGIRPYDDLGADHPLGEPYFAQMLAAYLMREFVFALVDHLAKAKNPAAAKLDRRIKRYLGLGNSAGLGLVPFITGHPQIIHRWCLTHEMALAEAMDRPAWGSNGSCAFPALIANAITYFSQDPRDGNNIFASYARLADELTTVAAVIDSHRHKGGAAPSWRQLLGSALPAGLHPETIEIVNSILLELYPDIIETYEGKLRAKEGLDLQPAMAVAELRRIISTNYDWLLKMAGKPGAFDYFWYYPLESPYEPRRGRRGTGSPYETETTMDLPMRVPALAAALATAPADEAVGDFVARHPEFASIAARVQSLDGLDYAEYRENSLAADFLPFAACRFQLAFYGMEKYDPRLPRSTKGSFLQGAPLADEIGSDSSGDWPFPLAPENPAASTVRPDIVPLRLLEQPDISIHALTERVGARLGGGLTADEMRLYPLELRKLLTRACLGRGLSLATADAVCRLAVAALKFGAPLGNLLNDLATSAAASVSYIGHQTINAGGAPAFAIAGPVLDLACVNAKQSGQAIGIAYGRNIGSADLIGNLAYWGAQRGYLCLVADCGKARISVAGADDGGTWLAEIDGLVPAWATGSVPEAATLPNILAPAQNGGTADFAVMCLTEPAQSATLGRRLRAHLEKSGLAKQLLAPQDVKARDINGNHSGLFLPSQDFAKLTQLARAALVPEDTEKTLTP